MAIASRNLWDKIGKLAYGGDYYPEQWPRDIWQEDLRLMKEAGVNLVSLGVFGWSNIQKTETEWTFEWLDEIMDMLYENSIFVLLGTATSSPPAWLTKKHPEILPVDKYGKRYYPGSRQHYCPSSDAYRNASRVLVKKLAVRYGKHKALAGWHVNNEYGCHVSECYCDKSEESFRNWLKNKYDSIEKLNAAWYTNFWSQRYNDFSEITLPRYTPTYSNPTQEIDFKEFSSDTLIECFENEVQILREITPDVPVTTNFIGFFKPVNYFKFRDKEDFTSQDSYPDPSSPDGAIRGAMGFDLIRSIASDQRWLLTEQAPGAVNGRDINVPKRKGMYSLWSMQAIAHGANGAMSFQWRASKGGAEKFHSAMVSHDGHENRIFREVSEFGNTLKKISCIRDTVNVSDVAILFSWKNWWALEMDSHPVNDVSYVNNIFRFYKILWKKGISCDFVSPEDDFSKYKLIIAPSLYLVEGNLAHNLEKYVKDGGKIVFSYFSGIVDDNDQVFEGGYLSPFANILGIEVKQFWPLGKGEKVTLRSEDGRTLHSEKWVEIIRIRDANPIATAIDEPFSGWPLITANKYGSGSSWYLGTELKSADLKIFMEEVLNSSDLRSQAKTDGDVEIQVRKDSQSSYLFLLNHNSERATVELQASLSDGIDILSGKRVKGIVDLGPYEYSVIKLELN